MGGWRADHGDVVSPAVARRPRDAGSRHQIFFSLVQLTPRLHHNVMKFATMELGICGRRIEGLTARSGPSIFLCYLFYCLDLSLTVGLDVAGPALVPLHRERVRFAVASPFEHLLSSAVVVCVSTVPGRGPSTPRLGSEEHAQPHFSASSLSPPLLRPPTYCSVDGVSDRALDPPSFHRSPAGSQAMQALERCEQWFRLRLALVDPFWGLILPNGLLALLTRGIRFVAFTFCCLFCWRSFFLFSLFLRMRLRL